MSKPPGNGRNQSYRSRHRMRSHQEAHDAGRDETLPPVLDHPLVPAGEPLLVTEQHQLEQVIEQLQQAGSFAYDSEFIGEHTYYPRLCVVQVATAERVTLLDPLSELDLTPFWELIADPATEVIVHAGVQDLEPVVRHLNRPPASIFDVQMAAAFVNLHYPSALGKLVTEVLGADLGHGLKFSQWDHRPLSQLQIQYAANDVRYLPLLRSVIGQRLEEHSNTAWAAEECATLENVSLYTFNPKTQRIRVRGVESLGPRRRTILRAIVAWREQTARMEDVPPRAFIKDGVLYEMARSTIESPADLSSIRGLPRPVRQRHGEAIVAAIAEARAEPAVEESFDWRAARDLEIDRDRVNALWDATELECKQRGIHPAIVASKKELTHYLYAEQLGKSRESMRITQGWRRELFANLLGL